MTIDLVKSNSSTDGTLSAVPIARGKQLPQTVVAVSGIGEAPGAAGLACRSPASNGVRLVRGVVAG